MKKPTCNLIHCLFILLLLMPAAVSAQKAKPAPAPCPSVNIDLSQLSELTSLAELRELPALPELPELSELSELATINFEQMQPDLSSASEKAKFSAEKRKVFEKTYKVSATDLLNINNKFGKVHVNTWNRKEIQVKVDMVARAGTDGKAQEILNLISIAENREGKIISLKTEMAPMKIAQSNNKSFEINYTVFMPAENPITVKNSFGDVYLAALKGRADVTVKYGALKTGNLSHPGNFVKVAYGAGNCGFINQGNVEVSYGSMVIEGTNGLQGYSKYSDFKLGNLSNELDMEVKYGSFQVSNIGKDIRKINLNTGFSPVSLNFEDNAAFNFDVNVQFGNFKYDKSLVSLTSLEKDNTSAEYRGRFGASSSKSLISISSKFGDVQFTK